MKITTKSRYGLRAMIQMALDEKSGERTTLGSIARKQCLSERYLEQIFNLLRRGGLVHSARGVTGGYSLAREPAEITVQDILTVLEDPVEIVGCLKKNSCPKEDACVSFNVWKRIFDCMMNCAGKITLEDILSPDFSEKKGSDEDDDIFGPCCDNESEKRSN